MRAASGQSLSQDSVRRFSSPCRQGERGSVLLVRRIKRRVQARLLKIAMRFQRHILLVEDNPGDAMLVKEAFRDAKITHQLHVAEDGVIALEFLRKQSIYGSAPDPDLILLDLNLPRKDGREVLAEIKQDHALIAIPVIILSTSEDQ